jgi:hypothetical protein
VNPNMFSTAQILSGDAKGQIRVDLNDFKRLYRSVAAQQQSDKIPEVEILLLSEGAIVKFASAKNFVIRVHENRPLSQKDFEVILSPRFYGNIKPIPLRGFIWTEIRKNGGILIPLYLLFLFFLSFDINNSSLQTMSQMLVDANALFIAIFILFTISQNRELLATKKLVEDGMTHQMIQNDLYMTGLSITSLLFAFLTVVIIESPVNVALWSGTILSWQVEVTVARLVGVFALILLVDCLLSVTQYYLKIMRTAVEGKMYRDIMSQKEIES